METDMILYIAESIPELSGRIFPLFTTDLSGVSLVYKFTPLSGGHVKESQLEAKIIHEDYDYCKEVEGRLKGLLDMEEDAPFISAGNTIFRSQLSGGGCLFNDGCQMVEDTLYFVIDWRNKNGK